VGPPSRSLQRKLFGRRQVRLQAAGKVELVICGPYGTVEEIAEKRKNASFRGARRGGRRGISLLAR
jgi:hypothetical protein